MHTDVPLIVSAPFPPVIVVEILEFSCKKLLEFACGVGKVPYNLQFFYYDYGYN